MGHHSQPTYKTIVISDLHLGSKGAKAAEVNEFLRAHSCHQLILNGDIIDGWQLKKGGSCKRKHTAFFRCVLKMMDKWDTEVIYLRGNHDDFLEQVLPLKIGKQFSIRQDYMLKSFGKKYFITHGDIFDSITSQMKWLAYLGDIGYTFLLWLNKWYNQYRSWQGKPYYSLSQVIKQKVKAAVNFISDFEEKLAELAKAKGADGIICGHIHKAEIKMIDGVAYMNSGDWVESLTALVETHKGEWQIIEFPHYNLKAELNEILGEAVTVEAEEEL
jgi:UDP-2,3-diacylglucosamine pyrophosphatase LpxH